MLEPVSDLGDGVQDRKSAQSDRDPRPSQGAPGPGRYLKMTLPILHSQGCQTLESERRLHETGGGIAAVIVKLLDVGRGDAGLAPAVHAPLHHEAEAVCYVEHLCERSTSFPDCAWF